MTCFFLNKVVLYSRQYVLRSFKLQLYNVHKLIICLVFASLAACSKDISPTTTSPYEDLNTQHTEELRDIRNSVREQYSDLIGSLQVQETNDLFLPYIASYEAHKEDHKSSLIYPDIRIHPDIKIFFFDRSRLPENQAINVFVGVCFSPERFIFIDRDFWFALNHSENLEWQYSILDSLSKDGTYQQSSIDRDGSISREVKRYEELSEEKRQENIETIQRLEETLSDDEKIAARQLRRELLLFHELGHCDLDRDHEMINSSIMNYGTTALIRNEAIKKKECDEDLLYMDATEECRTVNIELSYAKLIEELFSTQQEEEDVSLIKPNPEAVRLLYQETYQRMQMYTDAIDYEVQNNWSD